MIGSDPALFSALAESGWQVIGLPIGYWPMFSRPRVPDRCGTVGEET